MKEEKKREKERDTHTEIGRGVVREREGMEVEEIGGGEK